MTESEWGTCADIQRMVSFLRASGRATDRKLRLFAVACCRRIWQHLKDKLSCRLVAVAEAFADGAMTLTQLQKAFDQAADAQEAIHYEGGGAVDQAAAEAVLGLRADLELAQVFEGIAEAVGSARVGEAWERIQQAPASDWRAREEAREEEYEAGVAAEAAVQVALLRDVFGNPFRPLAPLDASLVRSDGTLLRLARAAYEDRVLPHGTLDPARLGVLADALEEAGCDNDELLGQLRCPGPHVRGCFALDLVLGNP